MISKSPPAIQNDAGLYPYHDSSSSYRLCDRFVKSCHILPAGNFLEFVVESAKLPALGAATKLKYITDKLPKLH